MKIKKTARKAKNHAEACQYKIIQCQINFVLTNCFYMQSSSWSAFSSLQDSVFMLQTLTQSLPLSLKILEPKKKFLASIKLVTLNF